MSYKKVLVPLDTSQLAERALPYARAVGRATGSQVILFTVGTSEMQMNQPLQGYLEGKAREMRDAGVNAVSAISYSGTVAGQIIDYSNANGVDLLIASTHGRSGLGRWAVGDVARKLLEATAIPVLLVKSKAPERYQVDFRRILLPLDGSAFSEIAITHAEILAGATGAEVIAVRVVEAPAVASLPVDWVEGLPVNSAQYEEKLIDGLRKESRQYLERVRASLESKSVKVRWLIAQGKAATAIANVAEDEKVDLIVMGTHGRSGMSRWIYGSVATRVSEDSTKPVLLVRPCVPAA